MLEQWRIDLLVSEVLALEVAACRSMCSCQRSACARARAGRHGSCRCIRSWVHKAVERAEQFGAILPVREVGTHTFRHSYARHLLMNGIPINFLSRWLGHSSIQATLIYLELVPDPTGSLAMVPLTTLYTSPRTSRAGFGIGL